MKQFEEGVKLIRHFVGGDSARFPTGEFGISFTIKEPAPIYVSAEGPKGLQLAGRCADGVILGTGFDLRVFEAKIKFVKELNRQGVTPKRLRSLPRACSASATTARRPVA